MTVNSDQIQKLGREQLETASSVAASFARGLQTLAAETTDFSKKSIETNAAYIERLLNAKSFDEAIQIQSEHMKSVYESLVAQTTRMSELYTTLAKDSFKPVEDAFTRFQADARGKSSVGK